MKPKTLLSLAVLVAVLGAFIWFFERDLPSTDERAERAKKVFATLAADEVTALVVERDGVRLELERTASSATTAASTAPAGSAAKSGWKIVAPLSARADAATVDALVSQLASLARERTLTAADRQAVGLATPRAKVTLRTKTGEHRLEIGGDVPASSNLVLAVDGSPDAVVAPRAFFSELTRSPGDWRARDLFPAEREKIERITLDGAGGRVLLAQRAAGTEVESPFVDRADRDAAGTLLSDLTGLRAEKFVEATDLAALGLAPPRATVEVAIAGRTEPFRVELGAAAAAEATGAASPSAGAARSFARVDGQLVEIASRFDEALARPPAAWRARSWSSFDSWSVDQVKVTTGNESLSLSRHEGDWMRGAEKIPFGSVGDLLYAVSAIRADQFGDAKPPTGAPELVLELLGAGDRRETLSLWSARDGFAPARVSGREITLLLARSAVDDLHAKLAAVREAKPVAPAAPSPGPATTGPSSRTPLASAPSR